MKSKAAVPLLVGLFVVMLVAGIIGYNLSGTKNTALSASASSEKAAQELEENVFPKDKVVDVKITIDEADFQDILANASLEEYKTASVEYNGIKLDNVGIRAKGNLSLRSVVQMTDSDRYSFKLSFDEYLSNQTLYGISKINLNNNYSDASYMREFLTYELARQMGLPVPEVSYVNVYINGELWGFYLAVEQVGDAYLERNFGNSYGALYKGEMTGSGSDLTWLGEDLASYTGLAQKSKSSNNDVVIGMIDELNNGTDYESVLDIENVLKYVALNVATNNMDSYLGSNKQNYYLYEDDGIFSVLPWDYNMAFGGMGGGMGGGRMGGGGEAGTTTASVLIDEPTQGAVAERPLIAKLLAVDEYKELYHEILTNIVQGYLSEEQFAVRVQEIYEMISPYVEKDPSSFYTYEQYEQGVTQLKATNTSMVTSVVGQLNGTIASTNSGQGSGGGMGGGGGMRGGRNGMAGNNGQNAQQGQTAQQGAAPQQGQTAQQGAAPDQGQAAQQGAAPQQGQAAQQGAAPEQGQAAQQGAAPQQGEMPAFGGGGMGGPPGGMGGGGGMPGMGAPGQEQGAAAGSTSEAVASGALVIALLLACLFIAFYKRQR
jgi:spore coat protein H